MGLTNAHVDTATGSAYPDSQGATWADLTTWAEWLHWDANPCTTISHEQTLDAGALLQLIPTATAIADGEVTLSESHSDDGVTWSAYAAIGALLHTRYVRIKVTVTGSYPTITDAEFSLMTDRKEQIFDDLVTSGLSAPYRLGVGDIRLPISTALTVVIGVAVTFQNTGAGWSYELIDKDSAIGPRIKIYNAAGVLADATIDATVRGA